MNGCQRLWEFDGVKYNQIPADYLPPSINLSEFRIVSDLDSGFLGMSRNMCVTLKNHEGVYQATSLFFSDDHFSSVISFACLFDGSIVTLSGDGTCLKWKKTEDQVYHYSFLCSESSLQSLHVTPTGSLIGINKDNKLFHCEIADHSEKFGEWEGLYYESSQGGKRQITGVSFLLLRDNFMLSISGASPKFISVYQKHRAIMLEDSSRARFRFIGDQSASFIESAEFLRDPRGLTYIKPQSLMLDKSESASVKTAYGRTIESSDSSDLDTCNALESVFSHQRLIPVKDPIVSVMASLPPVPSVLKVTSQLSTKMTSMSGIHSDHMKKTRQESPSLSDGSSDQMIKVCDVNLRPANESYSMIILCAEDGKLSVDENDAARRESVGLRTTESSNSPQSTPLSSNTHAPQASEMKPSGSPTKKEVAAQPVLAEKAEKEVLVRQVEALQAQLAAAEHAAKAAMPSPVLSFRSSGKDTSSETKEPEDMFDVGKGLESLFIARQDVDLSRELGRGGFGIVYEATYAFQKVAVKQYMGTRMPEKEASEMRHELDMMRHLQHQCLVRLLGLVYEPNSPAMMVMEYGENGSLYHFLHSQGDITWNLRLRIAEELVRGLAYLHQKKIIHRDMKSLNVVLDGDFHAKWCDFGLAALKLHTTTTSKEEGGSAVGTLRWMAPELFSRKTSSPSTASDIWAFGMVMFELASREIPFKDARDNEQVKAFIKEERGEEVPDACEQASPGFAAIMRRCWLARGERPTAADLARELREVTVTESAAPSNEGLKKETPPQDVTPSYSHYRY